MATNKNQHFVPRCYLRPFSKDEQGAAINLYNLDRMRFIPDAPAKNQCSRDYFYGTDENLEKAIQSLEGEYAAKLREIRTPGFQLTDDCRQALRLFWLMQHMRTEAAAQRAAMWFATMSETIGSEASNFRLEIKEAVQLGLGTFATEMHSIDDIKICLVHNCTRIPFITSDDPAVFTNRWSLIDRRRSSLSFGIGSAGNLLLLPLTPDILCLGYDGDVYSVPNKSGWVRARRESDIDAFNEHQFLHCRANIFVKDEKDEAYVHEAFQRIVGGRLKERHVLHYAVLDEVAGGYKRYKVVDHPVNRENEKNNEALLHVQVRFPKPTRWPSQIAWRATGRAYANTTGTGYLRKTHLPSGASSYRKLRTP